MEQKFIDWANQWEQFFRDVLPFITTTFLSCFGGLVSYIQRMRIRKVKFSFIDLTFDLVISSFAGFLTYLLCQYSHIEGAMASILIAISGHMGTRAIASFEILRDRLFGIDAETKPKSNDK